MTENVVVIGAGPAGCTAALYAARANIAPLVLEGLYASAGQLNSTTLVENFPGFVSGIQGPELVSCMKQQAQKFGARFKSCDVTSVDLSSVPFKIFLEGENSLHTNSLIIATGAVARKLDVPGVDEFWQKGISTCAVCDGALPIFRNRDIVVVGGGDSAMETASFLSRFASKVIIIHRRNSFRASKILSGRILQNSKVEVLWNTVVTSISGNETVNSVMIENVVNGLVREIKVSGVFFSIGHDPQTSFFKDSLELLDNDCVKVLPGTSITSISGVFAAGDVADAYYRQAITASGFGCIAALECERWLSSNGYLTE